MPLSRPATPFDTDRLDELMGEAGIDVLLATSPHNVRYLLGGYRFFLYEVLDGIGMERYLPVVGYVRGAPDLAFYVGAGNEDWGTDIEPLWIPATHNASWTAPQAAALAAGRIEARGLAGAAIAVEPPYLPSDAHRSLVDALGVDRLLDAGPLLEELRAVKSERELGLLRQGATAVVDAMLATIADGRVGETKREIAERLRLEETRRGLTFGYCLIAAGASANRAPSLQQLPAGGVLSLDSGAHFHGYVADLTRMGVAGEPSMRAEQLLMQIARVQDAARGAIRAGALGGEPFTAAAEVIAGCEDGARMTFLAHGTGLLSHEAPRMTDTGSPPYPATHRDRPLLAGMVISVETHAIDETVGFVKLEDTVIVTADGCEPCGDHGRGWNLVGG